MDLICTPPQALLTLGKHSLPAEMHPQPCFILIWRQGLTKLPGLEPWSL